MSNRERILSVLTENEICDDCLSERSGVRPRQTVYITCTNLSKVSIIQRQHGKCHHCRKYKIVNMKSTSHSTISEIASAREQTQSTSSNERPWFWEGHVQEKVVSYLIHNGFEIKVTADTAARTQGKDIIATRSDGQEHWISVKGYPEKSQHTQARHWFSAAIFDLVLYREENQNVKLAIALPAGFATYQNLLPRINWLKQTMQFDVYWVAKDGNVHKE